LRFASLLLLLAAVHIVLAYHAGDAQAVWPQSAVMAMQGVALVAVGLRFWRSPQLLKWPWLLLGLAALMQLLWAGTNLLTTILGDKGGYLTAIGVVLSGLYMIPCMYMVAQSFVSHEPRLVMVLDLILSCVVALLLYRLVTQVMYGPLASDPNSIYLVIDHADAVDFSLAGMAILRLFGARSFRWRFFYFSAASYLLVNAIVAYIYNRVELRGLPWWAGSLVDIPYIVLAWVAVRQPPRFLRWLHPSLSRSQTIALFAPIMLSLIVLLLGISVSRISYGVGIAAVSIALLFYGLRVALIQSRSLDIQRALNQSAQRLEMQVGHDALTGIPNRVALDTRLNEVLQEGARTGAYCSLLMIDIDFFKQYNDCFGHIAGDACLVKVANALSSSPLRAGDLVARYGGEEFAVVLAETSAQNAWEVAKRLIAIIERLQIAHPACALGRITVSIGIAAQTRETPINALALLDEADRALYRAKSNGRNRCEVSTAHPFDPRDPELTRHAFSR
jgi:diguanylate cyclase (GGDEF)-like protein